MFSVALAGSAAGGRNIAPLHVHPEIEPLKRLIKKFGSLLSFAV